MEFKIEKAALLSGLYLAQGISDRKSTMPILANVLLRTDGKDKLLVAATDLNVTVTAELPCKVEKEGGLTVGAKHLHEIVKSLPGDSLELKRTENQYADIRARMVSTDGHRLSKIERPLENGTKLATGIIIPRKGLMELRRALENAEGSVE